MKRNLLLLIAVFVVISQCFSLSFAAKNTKASQVSIAIKKYKAGNYTGCLQDTQAIVGRDPSNAIAYYYMAMSYVQANQKDKAIEAYQKVLNLGPNTVLYSYATTGKRCIETPEQCHETEELTEIDKMVTSPYGDGLSESVKQKIEQKRLDKVRNEMNSDEDVNNYKMKQFKDFSKQRSDVEDYNKIVEEDKMPTNDEIVAALKVLKKAGLAQVAAYPQVTNPMMMPPQNAEQAQLSMMLGSQGQSNGNNNNMMNMIPFMLAQNKNGQTNGGNPYSPQLMQTMMMNSMLPDFNFNTKNDN